VKSAAVYLKDPNHDTHTLVNLFEDEASVGSSLNADIHINDFRCNGIHAYIKQVPSNEKGDFLLVDLGNGSNTFFNGKRVKEAYIKSGESFTLGNTELILKKVPKSLQKFQDFYGPGNANVIDEEESEEQKEKAASEKSFFLVTEKNLLQVSLFWGQQLLESRTFYSGANISIGSDKKATFGVTLPKLTGKDFDEGTLKKHARLQRLCKVAKYKNEKLELIIPASATGLVWLGEDAYTLKDLRDRDNIEEDKTFPLSLRVGDRADIQIGELTLSFKFVLPAEKLPRMAPISIDKNLLKIFGAVFLSFFTFMTLVMLWPKTPEDKVVKKIPPKLKKVLYEAGIKSAKEKRKSAIGEILSQTGGRAKSEEGAAKAKKKPKESKTKKVEKVTEKTKTKETPKDKPKVAKTKPTPKTKVSAAKGKAASKPKVDISSAFSSATSESIADSVSMKGAEQAGNTLSALSGGQFARGTKGLGAGGGGQSVGIGQLKGLSSGGGMGAGDEGLQASKGREIEIEENEETVLLDGLDPDVIAAVIRRYLPQIQHCYESRLVHRPEIRGKVLVKFQIIASGSVIKPSVMETTLNDSVVESCIKEKIKNWKFPKPRGGGVVDVKYPFLLMSTNES
jgi:outer membrane biosynthesis protein TonB